MKNTERILGVSGDYDNLGSDDFDLKRPKWQYEAECLGVGPKDFFPERGQSLAVARKYCDVCQVSDQCQEFVRENGITHGVWGGRGARGIQEENQSEDASPSRKTIPVPDLVCEAIRLLTTQELTMTEVSIQMGKNPHWLKHWKRRHRAEFEAFSAEIKAQAGQEAARVAIDDSLLGNQAVLD